MKHLYDTFVIRRLAEDRIFFINPAMPFEFFLDCFLAERPFFMVSQLEDGRIAITPNALVIPQNLLQAGYGPRDILPTEYEYVTIKDATYPLIVTAHPVANAMEWLNRFERWVTAFAKQPLAQFVAHAETMPVRFTAPQKMPVEVPVPTPMHTV